MHVILIILKILGIILLVLLIVTGNCAFQMFVPRYQLEGEKPSQDGVRQRKIRVSGCCI